MTANLSPKSRALPRVFTEKGLYMLATILKGEKAIAATLKIIETYAYLRAMVRDMEALQSLKDGRPEQAAKLSQAGHKLADLIGDNLHAAPKPWRRRVPESTKTTIELNLAVPCRAVAYSRRRVKITHEVTRTKK